MNDNDRNVKCDTIRGIAIILVVLGHAIQYSGGDYWLRSGFNIIYSFHMPLFMFISGLVTYKSDREINILWLRKKSINLVLPFVTWMFLPFIFNRNWKDVNIYTYCKNVIKSPDCGYWFLWELFLLCIVVFLSSIISKKLNIYHDEIVTILILLVICLFSKLLNFYYLGIQLLNKFAVFYFAGYYINKYKFFIKRYIAVCGGVCGAIWIFSVRFWRFSGDHTFIHYLKTYINYCNVSNANLLNRILNWCIYLYNWVIPFGGIFIIFAFVYLTDKFLRNSFIEVILCFLGKHTLEIYVTHLFFFEIIHVSNNLVLQIIINFITSLSASVLIILCFKMNKVGLLLFGKDYKSGA